MVVIARELLQYDKDNINYYINYPKIYLERDRDPLKQNMIDEINKNIFEDIWVFTELGKDMHEEINQYLYESITNINYLTEFTEEFNFHNVISISIEFTQIEGIYDISQIKSYNYDLELKREIILQDIFKDEIDFCKILKKYVSNQANEIINEIFIDREEEKNSNIYDNVCIDYESIFYFTEEHLVLPFSSYELDSEIMNLIEFKIPFNVIYPYLSKYAIKKIVHKVIL